MVKVGLLLLAILQFEFPVKVLVLVKVVVKVLVKVFRALLLFQVHE